jgi:hypothetical protein
LVASCIGTGLLKHPIEWKVEGMIEGKRRRGRRCSHILEDLKEERGYWKLKVETLDLTLCELVWKRLWTCCKTGCGLDECKAVVF